MPLYSKSAPTPSAGAGVGQWRDLSAGSGNPLTLPAGGMWAYFYVAYASGPNTLAGNQAGVAAGGTTVGASGANGYAGVCWQIS